MPIMLQPARTSNMFIVFQMLFSQFLDSILVKLLQVWNHLIRLHSSPTLDSLIIFPSTISVTSSRIRFTLYSCALFSKTWIEVSGSGPREVAKQLKDQQMVMAGHREGSMYKELKRIIPTAAAFGGATIGALSVCADLMGALGSGTGILLAVTIIYGYWESAIREGSGIDSAVGELIG
ncbi:hypothetical protein PSTG_05346 [Puccinia striiformis f. sp. tritici PST-78]|uniref:Translocon Sec61/SecY plug domain-containing protein n=1 Tax=Puccinia striiformis f. sp. tritici PST-78 TaxID=1165861 RepID=A0A0L0VQK7_9BASI|nr:hypothetical protein PSTG_05346 [Puccinia striiformis f. sp. tritici PST-78]